MYLLNIDTFANFYTYLKTTHLCLLWIVFTEILLKALRYLV